MSIFGPEPDSAQPFTSSCCFSDPVTPSWCLYPKCGADPALPKSHTGTDQRAAKPGREAWHGELGWIHLSEALMLSGLPLSTFKHLVERWLGQAGCLCSCCAQWGETGTSGGRSPGGIPVAPLQGTQLSAAFLWMYGESNQRTCTRKPLNFANTMLINALITQGGRDVQRQHCGWKVLLDPALLTLCPPDPLSKASQIQPRKRQTFLTYG